ncbi:MAG: archaellin/type IV pilin N-terminal domain-containing protein [Thermoplasmata archaeon]
MHVFGRKARSWRKGRKRGVSPIIATILLVAITVVLAAVLYILISGLTKGPGNTPLSTAFGFGTPTQVNPTAATAGQCAAAHFCYEISISEASSGLTPNDVQLKMTSNTGTTIVGVTFYIDGATAAQGYLTGGAATNPSSNPWAVGAGTITGTTVFSGTFTIWIDAGAASVYGQGDQLTAFGIGAFSSSVGPLTLP